MAPRKPAAVATLAQAERIIKAKPKAKPGRSQSLEEALTIIAKQPKPHSDAFPSKFKQPKAGTKVKVPQYDPKNKGSVQDFELAYAAQLSDLMHSMPRGAQVSFNRMVNKMDVRNLRGRLIAQVKLVGE